MTRDYSYDALLRPKNIEAKDPARNVVFSHSYQYDPVGNILSNTTDNGIFSYTYDDLDQIIQAETPLGIEEFTYDAVGNRLTSKETAGNWTYNESNQLLRYADVERTYDDNGNIIKEDDNTLIKNYRYGSDNRLSRVDDAAESPIAQYYYDPFGRRLWKEVNGQKIYFLYADEGMVAELDADGNIVREYGFIPNSRRGSSLLYQSGVDSLAFYQNDQSGAPQKLVEASGAVKWAAVYKAFGKAQILTENVTNNIRADGRYYDHETGYHNHGVRFYNPATGGNMYTAFQTGGNPPTPPPPTNMPGEGWRWTPDPNDRRGGKWRDSEGRSTGWDAKDGHWDTDDGKGNRQRYNRHGAPMSPSEAHGPYKGPTRQPLPFKLKCGIPILDVIGIILDGANAYKDAQKCKDDPCNCDPLCV